MCVEIWNASCQSGGFICFFGDISHIRRWSRRRLKPETPTCYAIRCPFSRIWMQSGRDASSWNWLQISESSRPRELICGRSEVSKIRVGRVPRGNAPRFNFSFTTPCWYRASEENSW
jgi:hypothetical protein